MRPSTSPCDCFSRPYHSPSQDLRQRPSKYSYTEDSSDNQASAYPPTSSPTPYPPPRKDIREITPHRPPTLHHPTRRCLCRPTVLLSSQRLRFSCLRFAVKIEYLSRPKLVYHKIFKRRKFGNASREVRSRKIYLRNTSVSRRRHRRYANKRFLTSKGLATLVLRTVRPILLSQGVLCLNRLRTQDRGAHFHLPRQAIIHRVKCCIRESFGHVSYGVSNASFLCLLSDYQVVFRSTTNEGDLSVAKVQGSTSRTTIARRFLNFLRSRTLRVKRCRDLTITNVCVRSFRRSRRRSRCRGNRHGCIHPRRPILPRERGVFCYRGQWYVV